MNVYFSLKFFLLKRYKRKAYRRMSLYKRFVSCRFVGTNIGRSSSKRFSLVAGKNTRLETYFYARSLIEFVY